MVVTSMRSVKEAASEALVLVKSLSGPRTGTLGKAVVVLVSIDVPEDDGGPRSVAGELRGVEFPVSMSDSEMLTTMDALGVTSGILITLFGGVILCESMSEIVGSTDAVCGALVDISPCVGDELGLGFLLVPVEVCRRKCEDELPKDDRELPTALLELEAEELAWGLDVWFVWLLVLVDDDDTIADTVFVSLAETKVCTGSGKLVLTIDVRSTSFEVNTTLEVPLPEIWKVLSGAGGFVEVVESSEVFCVLSLRPELVSLVCSTSDCMVEDSCEN